jgi:hypothetical protein
MRERYKDRYTKTGKRNARATSVLMTLVDIYRSVRNCSFKRANTTEALKSI